MTLLQKVWAAFSAISLILIVPPGIAYLQIDHDDIYPAGVWPQHHLPLEYSVSTETTTVPQRFYDEPVIPVQKPIVLTEPEPIVYVEDLPWLKEPTLEPPPQKVEVTIITPSEPDVIDKLADDPIDAAWDAVTWILDKASNAIAISP